MMSEEMAKRRTMEHLWCAAMKERGVTMLMEVEVKYNYLQLQW